MNKLELLSLKPGEVIFFSNERASAQQPSEPPKKYFVVNWVDASVEAIRGYPTDKHSAEGIVRHEMQPEDNGLWGLRIDYLIRQDAQRLAIENLVQTTS